MKRPRFGYAIKRPREKDRWRTKLDLEGIEEIFHDPVGNQLQSGFHKMTGLMIKGDLLAVESFDRLGRDLDEIKERWDYITGRKLVDIVLLDYGIDTRSGPETAKTVSQVLQYFIDHRELLREEVAK